MVIVESSCVCDNESTVLICGKTAAAARAKRRGGGTARAATPRRGGLAGASKRAPTSFCAPLKTAQINRLFGHLQHVLLLCIYIP